MLGSFSARKHLEVGYGPAHFLQSGPLQPVLWLPAQPLNADQNEFAQGWQRGDQLQILFGGVLAIKEDLQHLQAGGSSQALQPASAGTVGVRTAFKHVACMQQIVSPITS